MKLLVIGCVLVSAYSQNLEGQGPNQYFERTPNSNLVQIKYVGVQGTSLSGNSQSSNSQRYGENNQFNNQLTSQVSQGGNQAFNNQRFQNQQNQNVNQQNQVAQVSQQKRGFSGHVEPFSFNNHQFANPNLVKISFDETRQQQSFNRENQNVKQQNQVAQVSQQNHGFSGQVEPFSFNNHQFANPNLVEISFDETRQQQSFNRENQNVNQQNQVAQVSQQNRGFSGQVEPFSFNNHQFANPNLVEISFDETRQQQFLQNQERQRQQFQNQRNPRPDSQSQQSQSQLQLVQRQQQQAQLVQREQQQRQQHKAQLVQRQQQQTQQQQTQQQQAQLVQREQEQRQEQAQLVQRQQQQQQLIQRKQQLAQRQQLQFVQRQQQQEQFALQQQNQQNQVSTQNQQRLTQLAQSQNQNRNPFLNNDRGIQQNNFQNRIIPAGPQREQSGLIIRGTQHQGSRPSRTNQVQSRGIQSFQNQFQQGHGFQQSPMRQISGHLQRMDSDEILGIFQPFSIPASASLYEGTVNSQFSCGNQGQGFFADPSNNCQQFHVCTRVQGRNTPDLYRFTFQCVDGEFFDQAALTCIRRAGPASGSCAAASSNVQVTSQNDVNRALQLFGAFSATPYSPGATPSGLCYLANNAHFVTGIRRK